MSIVESALYKKTDNGWKLVDKRSMIENYQREFSKKSKKEPKKSFLDIMTDPHFVGSKTRKIVEEKVFEKPRKPKPVNYDTELKIRISQRQKDELEKIANAYGMTMSEYIRELIEKDIYND